MIKPVKTICLLVSSILLLNLASCIKNDTEGTAVVDKCSGQPGPMYTAVKTLISQKCIYCHNASTMNGNMNFSVDCNIVNARARIKARAVDDGSMPPGGPLPQADKDKITAWINAGGAITN